MLEFGVSCFRRSPWCFVIAMLGVAGTLAFSLYPSAGMSVEIRGDGGYQVFVDDGNGFTEKESEWHRIEGSARVAVSGLRLGRGVLRIDPPVGKPVTFCEPRRRVHWFPGKSASVPLADVASSEVQRVSADVGADECVTWVVDSNAADPMILHVFSTTRGERLIGPLLSVAPTVLLTLAFFGFYFGFQRLTSSDRMQLDRWSEKLFVTLDARLPLVFVGLGAVLGLAFMLVRPPGGVPDEFAHSSKVALMAAGQFYGTDQGAERPAILANYGPFQQVHGEKFTVDELRQTLASPLSCAHEPPIGAGAPAGASPLMYLLPWASAEVTCIAGGRFGFYYYGAQLLNLFLYLALGYIGIRAAGYGRWVLFYVGLLPMSLYLASSISYDSNMLGLCLAYLGVLSGVYSGKISVRRAEWALFAFGLCVALSKPLAGWIFFAPWVFLLRIGGGWKPRLKWAALTSLAPAAVHAGWLLSLAQGGDAYLRPDVAAVNGMEALVAQPSDYIGKLLATTSSVSGERVIQGIAGVFGWLDTYPSYHFYQMAWGAALLALALNPHRKQYGFHVAAWAIGVSVITVLVLCIPFYAYWTQPSSPVIEGLQGRYFLPLVAFMGISFSFPIPSALRGPVAMTVLALISALSIMAIIEVLGRYYW